MIDDLLSAPWPNFRRGLYAITPDIGAQPARWLDAIQAVLDGGAALLQFRDKSCTPDRAMWAERARLACQTARVPFIVNDDFALARALGADGCHIGQHDGSVRAACANLGPDAIVGASCYHSVVLAQQAARSGASYVAFGAFYPSTTKPDAPRAEPRVLRAAQVFGLPVVAIGGITVARAAQLREAGADFVAVISDLFDAADVRARASDYAALFE